MCLCNTTQTHFIREFTDLTISERRFTENTESNITSCKFSISNLVTSYILLLRKITRYVTYVVMHLKDDIIT